MRRFAFALLGLICTSLVVAVTYADEGHKKDPAKAVTVEGELIDSACYTASDGEAKGKDHAECARECLGSGIPAAILPQGSKAATDMRFLLTNPKPLAPYAGQTIKVEGTQHANMHASARKTAGQRCTGTLCDPS